MSLIIGLIKGIVIGALVGYGAYAAGLGGDTGMNWVTYGVVGALVGLVAGRPIWSLLLDKDSTIWTGILRALFGYGVGVGIYALVAKVWNPGPEFTHELLAYVEPDTSVEHQIYNWQPLFGAALGALYGAFVEVDDASGRRAEQKKLTE
ncbi:MAG: hypothetical protein AAGC55_26380 [Myxococcota bacterium]